MNFMWNIRGVGGGTKVEVIRRIVREKKIQFLGLTETKNFAFSVHRIRV